MRGAVRRYSGMAQQGVKRTVALCYARKSVTRDKVDLVAVISQERGMQQLCDEEGLTPEWYRDASGHKSGRTEKGRTDWLRLKKRIPDPDVALVTVYVQDRASRSVLDTELLMKLCQKHNVDLVIPQSGLDTRRTGWKADVGWLKI